MTLDAIVSLMRSLPEAAPVVKTEDFELRTSDYLPEGQVFRVQLPAGMVGPAWNQSAQKTSIYLRAGDLAALRSEGMSDADIITAVESLYHAESELKQWGANG